MPTPSEPRELVYIRHGGLQWLHDDGSIPSAVWLDPLTDEVLYQSSLREPLFSFAHAVREEQPHADAD